MIDDAVLLRRYTAEKSETAFTELVHRHFDLVYSAALRRLNGDAHRAADVAQQIFTALARDAAKLSRHTVLTAWLYTATRNAAIDHIRAETRRARREEEATAMHTLLASTPEADWEKLRPVLDEVMDELTESDRTAVLLRFFQHQAFAEVGTVLHVTEDAARMRVERALDKLHALLARRGVTSTTAALGLALTQGGVTAAPTGLAAAATAVALSGAAAGGGTTIAGLLAFMNTTQIAPTVSLMAALVAVSAAVYNVHDTRAAETALAAVESQRATATARLQELQRRRKSAATQGGVLLSRAPASARPSIRIGDSADTVERLAAGREFLARHPEVQPMLDEQERRTFDVTTGSRLRTLGLPPADLERIATAAMHATGSRMNIGGVTFELGERPDEPFESPRGKLAELLGSETYQRYVTLQARERSNALVKAVATAAYESDTPLLPEQAAALTASIERHSTVRASIPGLVDYALDGKAIAADAAGMLSGPQMELFNAAAWRYLPSSGGPRPYHP